MWKCIIFITILFGGSSFGKPQQEQPKIVGGEEATTRIPYMASIQMKVNGTRRSSIPIIGAFLPSRNTGETWMHFCGGSIVGTRTILTAAHCLEGAIPQQMSIVVGTNDLTKPDESDRYAVESVLVHEDYKKLQQNDIGLIICKEPFVIGLNVQPVVIASKRAPPGIKVFLTGWGYTTSIRGFISTPLKLRQILLTIISLESCRKSGMTVSDKDTCTEGRIARGACGGDSGGPLVLPDSKEQIGIVSYGTNYCATGQPDVHSSPPDYTDWITLHKDQSQ